jgi:hypothetical protein
MKVSMSKRESFLHWFVVTCASTDGGADNPDSKFNKMVNSADWDSENISLSVVINGYEFDQLDSVFSRVDEHILKKSEKLAAISNFNDKKIEIIQSILSSQDENELKEIMEDFQ